jgi:hypothetical protein
VKYLNTYKRIEEQGTLCFTLLKESDYQKVEMSFRARNICSLCDGNSSRAPTQELEANAGGYEKDVTRGI